MPSTVTVSRLIERERTRIVTDLHDAMLASRERSETSVALTSTLH